MKDQTRLAVAVVANALELGEKVLQGLTSGENPALVAEAMQVLTAELNNEINNRGEAK
jgi:hypothetical protein